jgi:pimeloyl-ACP methyl ester carboxylesterase
MESRIQYATTADGVRIAYRALGSGITRVDEWGMFGHLQEEWRFPPWQEEAKRISQTKRYVRFNHRGSGLSQLDVTDFSLDALVLDLEAVVDALGLEEFALLGQTEGGPVSIAYAARHPERVSHLILSVAWAGAPDSSYESFRALRDRDWDQFLETYLQAVFGWGAPKQLREPIVGFFKKCMTAETGRAAIGACEQFDVSALLPQVKCPTLIVHHARYPLRGADVARELACGIPNARLILIEEEMWEREGWMKVEDAINAFLEEGSMAPRDGLTAREIEVLRLIAAGRTNREIAGDLVLSTRTVGRHITNMYTKIGARSKADATAYAMRHGLSEIPPLRR